MSSCVNVCVSVSLCKAVSLCRAITTVLAEWLLSQTVLHVKELIRSQVEAACKVCVKGAGAARGRGRRLEVTVDWLPGVSGILIL